MTMPADFSVERGVQFCSSDFMPRNILPLLFLFLAPLVTFAMRPLDVRKRESVLSVREYTRPESPLLKQQSSLQSSRFDMKEWSKRYSNIGSRRSLVALEESSSKGVLPMELFSRQDANLSTGDRASGVDGSKAEIRNWNRPFDRRNPTRFTSKPVIHQTELGVHSYFALADTLTMQDINRFQFRRSHSSTELVREAAAVNPAD